MEAARMSMRMNCCINKVVKWEAETQAEEREERSIKVKEMNDGGK